jgi:outer membrane protein TolC
LGQTASFGKQDIASALRTENRTASSTDINTIDTPIVAASGGLPLNLVQSGSLVISGAVAPSIAGGNSGFTGATGASNLNGASISSFGVFPGTVNSYQAGFALNLLLDTILPDAMSICAARTLARQSLLQANQQLLHVNAQVSGAYLSALTARDQIDSVAFGAASAREALEQANLRLRSGEGTNLELITAQRNYATALVGQAQAILASNVAQARLLRDMGVISVTSLTQGYKIPAGTSGKQLKSKSP